MSPTRHAKPSSRNSPHRLRSKNSLGSWPIICAALTRDKLARDRVHNQSQAIQTHEQVGREVRDAIKRIGGALPEDIPADEHIKEVEKRIKTATPKLELDERDATGLRGENKDK